MKPQAFPRRLMAQGSIAYAALILLAAASAILAGCSGGPPGVPAAATKKIRIAVIPWPASASIYIAQEKGYFRDEGLEATLKDYPSGNIGLADLLAGKADFGVAADTPIARAAVNGKPVVVVGTVCVIERPNLIVARKDRGISTAGDLRGKRIGMVAGSSAEFYLHIYLTTSYIHPKSVRLVDLPPDRVVHALLNGEVDAVSTWAPHTTALQDKLGTNGVILHDPGLYNMSWNIVSSKDIARRDPEAIVRFLRAILRADRMIAERPGEALAITAKKCAMDMAAVEREWRNCEFRTQLDQTLILNLEDQSRWMIGKKSDGDGKTPNILDYIHTKGLSAVNPEAVRIVSE
ncbi:MAG: ABC transporter substrate-binding protein [Deltaproteobacteria bacterium]